ncbi:metal-binding protein [Clostridia bacterium]|nr:metal-binding protein [Clostridia bacterium]
MDSERRYAFFCHKDCEAFPCHAGVDTERFNCLFCYCPLYMLGGECGGNFTYTAGGIKSCADCALPHDAANYDRIVGQLISAISKNL